MSSLSVLDWNKRMQNIFSKLGFRLTQPFPQLRLFCWKVIFCLGAFISFWSFEALNLHKGEGGGCSQLKLHGFGGAYEQGGRVGFS